MSEAKKSSLVSAGPKRKSARRKKRQVRQLQPYNVVLLDDDDHTPEYVVEMLRSLFGYPESRGAVMAREVDDSGRVVVYTTHKEKAELKRDQILAFGSDRRVAQCKGSMSAIIEPAEKN